MEEQLIALRTSLAARLAAMRGVPEDELPPALLDISVRRVGEDYYLCPADWEQLRHEEGGAGRPIPYWARPWPSGIALSHELSEHPPAPGTRVLELGCGLALPSVTAAKAGAEVLATDGASDAVVFAAHVFALNELEAEVAHVNWVEQGEELVERGPFDLVLAADVLYTRENVDAAIELFPRLGNELLIADPNRRGAERFVQQFDMQTRRGEDVSFHTLRFAARAGGHI